MNDVPFRGAAQEILTDISHEVATVLQEQLGLDVKAASQAGLEASIRVARRWGGVTIYFPRGVAIDELHWKIYQDFTGNNHKELAMKYGKTEQWIYKIIERVGRVDVARRQADLFPEG